METRQLHPYGPVLTHVEQLATVAGMTSRQVYLSPPTPRSPPFSLSVCLSRKRSLSLSRAPSFTVPAPLTHSLTCPLSLYVCVCICSHMAQIDKFLADNIDIPLR